MRTNLESTDWLEEPAWTGTHLALKHAGAALAVCTREGLLVGATPSAYSLLARVGIATSTIPCKLPLLWERLEASAQGEAIDWRPPNSDVDGIRLGCTRHALGGAYFLIVMREISDKHVTLVQQLHRQRLEATGRLVAQIVHDLRAPLASIVFDAEVLVDRGAELAPAALRATGLAVRRAADRLRKTVDGLLGFAKLGPQSESEADLAECIERTCSLLRPSLRNGGHRIDVALAPSARSVQVPPLVVEQILVNLVMNALEAARAPVTVKITTSRTADTIRIVVQDDGPGMSAESRARAFEPFFTTKQKNSGLGLTASRDAALDVGGDLRIEPSEQGARFVITLGAKPL
ncbi:HAMP domain-containing histidine kinase [Pendulispora brunnea]|uniref:histidine kinase n=1 Tax=Pendulispora brunnea TaxID=2905690 RepID=A0ABZ2K2J6_9BACT